MEYRIKKTIQKEKRDFSSSIFRIPYTARQGFTLLETMIAIAILLIAVVGPMSIIGGSLRNMYFVRDQMTAINLAQEGVEAVRQVRDTNFLKGDAWAGGFGNGDCTGGLRCLVDTNPLVIHKCNGSCTATNLRVYQNPTDGLYHQYLAVPGGLTSTVFTRRVDTTQVSVNEYKVDVTVTWVTGSTPGTIVVSESIFRWAKS